MTIKQSLVWATKFLKKSKTLSPALDAEILLSFVIKKPREFLFAHPEKKLTAPQWNQFKKLIARRAKHVPVTYITGHKYFYGLDFFINKNVLIPRPETELLIEETLQEIQNTRYKIPDTSIVDVGTGSGAIAITFAHHLPKIKIFATEISPGAIKVARKNIRHHKVAVTLLRGDLLKPLIKSIKYKVSSIKYLVVVANLPYLTTRQWEKTGPEIKKYEPRQALDGGADGLKHYRQLLQQIELLITSYQLPVTSILEIDPSQKKSITKLIKRRFPSAKIEIKKDLAGRNRIVILKIKNQNAK